MTTSKSLQGIICVLIPLSHPQCARHYHRLAGTICANDLCKQGIEGPCISLSIDEPDVRPSRSSEGSSPGKSLTSQRRLYHPEHFTCSRRGCATSLEEFHFVINSQPWCEHHAREQYAQQLSQEQRASGVTPTLANPWSRKPPRPPSNESGYFDHRVSSGYKPTRSSRTMERRRTIIHNVKGR